MNDLPNLPKDAALSQTAGMAEPLPMDTAPRDGTMVRLLVNFNDHATEDTAGPAWTIGAYPSDDESGGWQFAGWCWTHDHFTEGEGTPIGWLPMLAAAPAASGGEDKGDPVCHEDDGCPTEGAVLKRFWRSINTHDTKQLMAFYGVDDVASLIGQQVEHVQSLQAKLYAPRTPAGNARLPKSPREG